MTALALPMVVVALMLALAWGVSVLLFPLATMLARRHAAVARTLPLVAALPVLAAVAVGVAATLPGDPHLNQPFGCHCLSSMPSWSHLCPAHPSEALALLPFALLVLALWLPGRVRPLWRLMREPLGVGMAAAAPVQAQLSQPTALLVGWLRPTLVVDPRLPNALSAEQYGAVVAHERGHLARRDPLMLMLLRVLTVVAPRRMGADLVRAWLEHAEGRADALAAREVGDPLLVAEALLRCARLNASQSGLVVGWTSGSLERRVRRLLADDGHAVSASPDLGWFDLLLLGALAALALGSTSWVHHQVEHLLNFSL